MTKNFDEKEENPKKDLKMKNQKKFQRKLRKTQLNHKEQEWINDKKEKKDGNWLN